MRPDGTAETVLAVAPPVPVKRPPSRKQAPRGSILRDVFPVKWPDRRTDPEGHAKACAEYQYLRAAAGFCRSCPNRRNKWKHRCDECQEKERKRLASRSSRGNRKPVRRSLDFGFKKRRTSKYAKRAKTWLRLHGIRIGRRRKQAR